MQEPGGGSLSKSDFIRSLGCVRRVWLNRYRKDLRPELTAASLERIDDGQRVGALARLRYPNGVMVPDSSDPAAATRELIEAGATCLFEATLDSGKHLARVDVLWKEADGGWVIDEVKSKTIKPIAVLEKSNEAYDLAYQVLAARGVGLEVSAARLVMVDSSFVWNPVISQADKPEPRVVVAQPGLFDFEPEPSAVGSDGFDADRMLGVVDLSLAVGRLTPQIEKLAIATSEALASPVEPEVEVNTHCKKCDFVDHCLAGEPAHSILRLPGVRPKEVVALRQLGYESIDQIPDDYGLSEQRLRVRESIVTGRPQVGPGLADRLSEVSFPAAFIDYETSGSTFPVVPGTRPYQAVCFQWSAHVLPLEDGEPLHSYFLASSTDDPRAEFCRTLWDTVKNCASILHYSAFEIRQVDAMAKDGVPLASELLALLQERSIDLHKIVEAHVYLAEFRGSTSIKVVLPALAPSISYKDLDIGDGQAAGVAFREMVSPGTGPARRAFLREALLRYCELDTLAMVEIYRALKRLV